MSYNLKCYPVFLLNRNFFSVYRQRSNFRRLNVQPLDLSMELVPQGGSFSASDSGGCSGCDLTEHSGISPSPRTRSVKLYIIMMNRTFWCMQKTLDLSLDLSLIFIILYILFHRGLESHTYLTIRHQGDL